jgi:hypothetical protein
MDGFWFTIIVAVLNLVMVIALTLVLTALAKACDVEIDGRLKAGMIILAIVISLIPFLNLLSLIVWFGATVMGIAIYFDSV